jgi:hypothetical protein
LGNYHFNSTRGLFFGAQNRQFKFVRFLPNLVSRENHRFNSDSEKLENPVDGYAIAPIAITANISILQLKYFLTCERGNQEMIPGLKFRLEFCDRIYSRRDVSRS